VLCPVARTGQRKETTRCYTTVHVTRSWLSVSTFHRPKSFATTVVINWIIKLLKKANKLRTRVSYETQKYSFMTSVGLSKTVGCGHSGRNRIQPQPTDAVGALQRTEHKYIGVRFQVLTATSMKMAVFWDVIW
jgi:hypothetical protein